MIVDPEKRVQCVDSQLGEIWVHSEHNTPKLYGSSRKRTGSGAADATTVEDQQQQLLADGRLNGRLVQGGKMDMSREFARTGYWGFIHPTDYKQSDWGW